MTHVSGRVAGVVTFFEGAWLVAVQFAQPGVSCPANGCPTPLYNLMYSDIGLGLGVVTLIVGALGLWGARFALLPSGVFCAVAIVVSGYTAWVDAGYAYLANEEYQAIGAGLLAAAGLFTSVQALRSGSGLSEQANPMNLPVFG